MPLNASTNYAPPPAFGRFRLQHQIGAGVLGPVFRTEDPDSGHLVAVKVFLLDLPPERAADLAAELQRIVDLGLDHPRIARPIAAGVEGSVAYLAQQYIDAESLDVALRQYGPAPPPDAVRLISHMAEALDESARLDARHGSLHPRDILVTPGDTHVTGLGVALALERIGWRPPVRRPYAAPEREVVGAWSAAADVFALAAIACEVLTGRRPTPGTDELLPGLDDVRAADAAALRDVLEAALDAEPGRRPATAGQLAGALAAALLGSAAVASAGAVHPPAPRSRRGRGKGPRLPGLEDPLTDQPAEPPAAEPPAPLEVMAAAPLSAALESVDVPPAPEVDLPEPEPDPVPDRDLDDLGSLDLGSAEPPLTASFTPDLSAVDIGRVLEEPRDDRPPVVAPPIDDLREPGALVTEPLVPRAIDPATQSDLFRGSDAASSRSGWPVLPMAAMLVAGLAVGLVAGYEIGVRHTETAAGAGAPAASVRPAAATPAPTLATDQAVPPSVDGPEKPAAPVSTTSGPGTRPPAAAQDTARSAAPASRPAESKPAPTPPLVAAARGQITVKSLPANADVHLNGERDGVTPRILRGLSNGVYTVRVTRPGYTPQERAITISDARPAMSVTFALVRTKAASPPSTPAVSPAPAPAKPAATTPALRTPAPKTPAVKSAKPAARTPAPKTPALKIPAPRAAAPKPARSGAAAAPAAAASRAGSFAFETRPAGARVFVDGRAVGHTPLQLEDVAAGPHTIRFELEGYRIWTTTATIQAGKRTRIAASLDQGAAR